MNILRFIPPPLVAVSPPSSQLSSADLSPVRALAGPGTCYTSHVYHFVTNFILLGLYSALAVPQTKTESPSLSCLSQPNHITIYNIGKMILHALNFVLDEITMMLFFVDWGLGDLDTCRYKRYGSCCQGQIPSAIRSVHWSVDDCDLLL
jgi:hypothetical protein